MLNTALKFMQCHFKRVKIISTFSHDVEYHFYLGYLLYGVSDIQEMRLTNCSNSMF